MQPERWTRREMLAVTGTASLAALGLTDPWKALAERERRAADYAAKVLAKGPVGYWRLGEKMGPEARDETKNGFNGVYHGTPVYGENGAIQGDPDTAVKLDGQGAYIEIPDDAAFSQPTSGKGLTVEVWMRPDVLVFDGESEEHFIHWLGKGEPEQQEWGLRFYNKQSGRPNRISAYIWNLSGGLGSGAYVQERLKPGEWIYVVACYAPGDMNDPRAGVSLYKNGVLRGGPEAKPPQPGALYRQYNITPAHGKAPLRLGTRDRKSFLQGALDEVAIYPRVLSADEIKENYRAGARS